MNNDVICGLLGCGRAGNWSVDIDEISKEDQTLLGVVIANSALTLEFGIKNDSILYGLVDFLENNGETTYRFKIDKCLGGTLNWVIFEERLFIRLITKGQIEGSELFEVKIEKKEIKDLIEAIKDALNDING